MEKLVASRMLIYLHERNLIPATQAGFRPDIQLKQVLTTIEKAYAHRHGMDSRLQVQTLLLASHTRNRQVAFWLHIKPNRTGETQKERVMSTIPNQSWVPARLSPLHNLLQ